MDTSSENRLVVLKWMVIIGLALITNLLLIQITRTAFHEPQFESYCEVKSVMGLLQNEAACLSAGGQWNASVPDKETGVSGYCNEQFQCQKEYESAQKIYQRNGFLVSVVGGTLLLIVSVFLPVTALAVGSGLSFGAILSFIVGSTGYWMYMDEWLRLVVLSVAFIALVLLALKKLNQ
ncbi:MAG: hypothetical protein KA034_01100 [Candidatus Moranbacteria bacterium]|jgi:hypothetical protein|nr:hypothetical protein [Candidatus Moranbacteria bacterium]